jgi:hypothetical protein
MKGKRIQEFFGDDFEETLDSLLSVPGAFGNIALGVIRQIKPVDGAAFLLVAAGWAWLFFSYLGGHERSSSMIMVALLPTGIWFTSGIIAGFIFHIGAIGMRSLAYWESYLLILLFGAFGIISLRTALDPRDRRVYRAKPTSTDI